MPNKFIKGRKITAPSKTEAQYRNELLAIVALVSAALRRYILPLFEDADENNKPSATQVDEAFRQVRNEVEQKRGKSDDAIIALFLGSLFSLHRRRFNQMIQRSRLPDRVKMTAGLINVNPVFELAKIENTKIIKSVPEVQISKAESAVLAELSKVTGESKKKLEKELEKLEGQSKRRAGRIALDQNEKVNGSLNKESQEQTGAIGYQWLNRGDKRVRGRKDGRYPNSQFNHWNRGGKYFAWNSDDVGKEAQDGSIFKQVPADGHPGIPIGCRCVAVPVWVDNNNNN
jgi:hypothetical protein